VTQLFRTQVNHLPLNTPTTILFYRVGHQEQDRTSWFTPILSTALVFTKWHLEFPRDKSIMRVPGIINILEELQILILTYMENTAQSWQNHRQTVTEETWCM